MHAVEAVVPTMPVVIVAITSLAALYIMQNVLTVHISGTVLETLLGFLVVAQVVILLAPIAGLLGKWISFQ